MPEQPNISGQQTSGVIVQLLDSAVGRPMQGWRFAQQTSISIGRGEDQDVVLSDPYVSRSHAELQCRDGQWVLISRGRNGVLVENRLVAEFPVIGTLVFRLGNSGPTLRFEVVASEQAVPNQTLRSVALPVDVCELNVEKLREDVAEISEGDYFQQLQRKAKELRRRRQ